jgi:hypothetical protein
MLGFVKLENREEEISDKGIDKVELRRLLNEINAIAERDFAKVGSEVRARYPEKLMKALGLDTRQEAIGYVWERNMNAKGQGTRERLLLAVSKTAVAQLEEAHGVVEKVVEGWNEKEKVYYVEVEARLSNGKTSRGKGGLSLEGRPQEIGSSYWRSQIEKIRMQSKREAVLKLFELEDLADPERMWIRGMQWAKVNAEGTILNAAAVRSQKAAMECKSKTERMMVVVEKGAGHTIEASKGISVVIGQYLKALSGWLMVKAALLWTRLVVWQIKLLMKVAGLPEELQGKLGTASQTINDGLSGKVNLAKQIPIEDIRKTTTNVKEEVSLVAEAPLKKGSTNEQAGVTKEVAPVAEEVVTEKKMEAPKGVITKKVELIRRENSGETKGEGSKEVEKELVLVTVTGKAK